MGTIAFIPGMSGGWEFFLVLLVVLLLFGPKKLPELFRSLGTSLNEFKKGQRESAESDDKTPDSEKIVSDNHDKEA